MRRPRLAAAAAFGLSTALFTFVAWHPQARLSGLAPVLTIAAGLAHAIAGALTGPRLMDAGRTATPLRAGLLGAGTSLLALALFAPSMAAYLSLTDAEPFNTLGYLVATLYAGLFAFLGVGWALVIVSAAVGVALHRLATRSAAV